MKTLRKAIVAPIVASLMLSAAVATAMPASAASRNGVCETGEFCYYYNSNNAGSVSDFTTSIGDYGTKQPSCYDYKGTGSGQGKCIKNEAASVWNRTNKTVKVHYNSNYAGSSQSFAPGAKGNLNSTLKNNNASHKIGGTTQSTSNMSSGLYTSSGGWLSTPFDGYRGTAGRHEGIDFTRGFGSGVRALVDGKVLNVARGRTGRSGLSTIAVYNATHNKTIIYLHTSPSSSLYVGKTVKKGDTIGTESYRGITNKRDSHTHVEMRLGKRTLAAKSVGDWKLENPNPTSFWNARGYTVK